MQIERRLPHGERGVLHCIRAACAFRADEGDPPGGRGPDCPIGRLAAACRAAGLSIARADVRLTTIDERLLLASLALCQHGDVIIPPCEALIEPIGEAGAALAGSGVRVILRPGHRLLLARHGWTMPLPPERPSARQRRQPARSPAPVNDGTARARVIEFAGNREVVTSAELQSLGITRQYVSILLHSGILDRVTFGSYRLGALALAPRPSA